jgi:hypothetical protein
MRKLKVSQVRIYVITHANMILVDFIIIFLVVKNENIMAAIVQQPLYW